MEGVIPEPLKSINWLLGVWESTDGKGYFPTIKDFNYNDTLEFRLCGHQPLMSYTANSSHPEKKVPMHLESGYLRSKGNGDLSFMVAHNFGLTTLEEGKVVSEKKVVLESTNIARMSGAKDPAVLKVKREFTLIKEDQLEVKMWMSTSNTTELTEHLKATYQRKK